MLYSLKKNVCGVGPFKNFNFINPLLRTYNSSSISPFNIFISTNVLLIVYNIRIYTYIYTNIYYTILYTLTWSIIFIIYYNSNYWLFKYYILLGKTGVDPGEFKGHR